VLFSGLSIASFCLDSITLFSPQGELSLGDLFMSWFRRAIHIPASETQLGLVLAVCIFTMSVMSIAMVWQAQVIAKQNAVIHMLASRFGN
jgi:glucose dehydrogenase